MNGEFPEPDPAFYVLEKFPLGGGGSITEFVAGPFLDPDAARRVRDQIRAASPGRNVHCVEHVSVE